MKKSKFSDSQIVDALKRVENGLSVPEICRELGISAATFYKWRAKYGGMDVPIAYTEAPERSGSARAETRRHCG